MDKINIRELTVFAKHGVLSEENVLGQKFVVSVSMYTDTRSAAKSDDINKSVDYGAVAAFITQFMSENTYSLIETVAEELAEGILLEYGMVNKVWLEVRKPWAPIGLPAEYVSVEIERAWHTAYIATGSNMGDRERYIRNGVSSLENTFGCEVCSVSSLITTKPYGPVEQADFINGCIKLKTLLTPEELLKVLHGIELEAGRKREQHWGPRTLDLDIIMYDDLVMDTESLTIPHADMANRDFVLIPMNELAPYLRHPILNMTMRELYEKLLDQLNA